MGFVLSYGIGKGKRKESVRRRLAVVTTTQEMLTCSLYFVSLEILPRSRW